MSALSNIVLVSSAVVVGIIGAASIFILTQLRTDNRAHSVGDDSDTLRLQVLSLQREIEALKKLQKKSNQKKKQSRQNELQSNNISYASDTDTADYRSVVSTDIESDEEYYDADSDDDVTLTEEIESTSVKKALEDIDNLLSNGSDSEIKEAYEHLIKLSDCKKYLSNDYLSEILWRLCRCCQKIVYICEKNNDNNRKIDIINEGVQYGKEALLYNPENFNAHKWYAIIIGLRSKGKGVSERIDDGNTYLHHIQEAIKINPRDAVLFHLQGRFKFEIASLSWFEKKAAAAIYGNLPIATYDEALADFQEAEQLNENNWKENRLYIAKCYIGKSNYKDAVEWLESAISITCKSSDDYNIESEAKELLERYK